MDGRGCDENQMITTNISPTFCQPGITASFLPFMRRQFGFSISGAFLLKTTDSFDTEIMLGNGKRDSAVNTSSDGKSTLNSKLNSPKMFILVSRYLLRVNSVLVGYKFSRTWKMPPPLNN